MKQDLGLSEQVALFVPGRPRTKGSLKPLHIKAGPGKCRVTLVESGEHAVMWKREMIRGIRDAVLCTRWPDAVLVDLIFLFERSHTQAGMLWPVAKDGIYAHGDEDKLRRNALDALTQSGLILDDSLVVGGGTLKRFADIETGEQQGVVITVRHA